jgi:hypothetical protein
VRAQGKGARSRETWEMGFSWNMCSHIVICGIFGCEMRARAAWLSCGNDTDKVSVPSEISPVGAQGRQVGVDTGSHGAPLASRVGPKRPGRSILTMKVCPKAEGISTDLPQLQELGFVSSEFVNDSEQITV